MAKIRMVPVASLLDIEKALTKSERRDLLDTADLLVISGGLSSNRRLYKNDSVRENRKEYQAFRNRAIVYTLIETDMRRTAVGKLNLDDVDFDNRSLKVLEKGGITHIGNIWTLGQENLLRILLWYLTISLTIPLE